jgi:hypothetical protein
MEAIHQLHLKNNNLRESLWKLQAGMSMELEEEKTNSPSTSTNLLPKKLGPSSTLSPIPLHLAISIEPKVSLPYKFDGTRARFRGFIN